jgi:DNA-binding SARP family transcriptional activator
MALSITLLGPPHVDDGARRMAPPRGRKCWMLLAYLLLTDRPPGRERLAALLFPEADDPRGALRWSLSELRRVLGPEVGIGGDPVVLSLPPAAVIDVDRVRNGAWRDAVALPGFDQQLLEGVTVSASASFELWLANERRRANGAAASVLHEAALACLAAGDPTQAVGHAARLVEVQPLEESHHVLLVRCLHAMGDGSAARAHAQRCARLFRSELQRDPSPALQEVARTQPPRAATPRPQESLAMLAVAETAIAAGAVTQGLQTLSEAALLTRREGDRRLLARVLLAQGHALVHTGFGGDEQGGAVLHEAATLAIDAGEPSLAAKAFRDLAFADLQRGRYDRALAMSARAARLAAGDETEMAWIEATAGACLSDQAHYAQAVRVLRSAVRRAERTDDIEAAVYARSFLGRLHLLRGELSPAAELLEQSAREARAGWRAYAPWPESLLAEVELRTGTLDAAEARFERAFALGRQLDDPCFESIAERGLGLVAAARGQFHRGHELLADAPRRSRRRPDSYLWIEAYGLDALCDLAIARGSPCAARWVEQLEAVAGRCGMRELLARAWLHRARLSDPGALDAARVLATAIDNPALQAQLTGPAAGVTRPLTRTGWTMAGPTATPPREVGER